MDENKSRPAENAAQNMLSSSWVHASNPDATSAHAGAKVSRLREDFLQRITGAATKGSGSVGYESPVRRTAPAVTSSSKGPVPAGDIAVLAQSSADPWLSSEEHGLPSLSHVPALWSSESLPDLEARSSAQAFTDLVHQGDSSADFPGRIDDHGNMERSHPARDSEDVLSRYRRVVYPPSEGEKTGPVQGGISRTASYPELPAVRKQTSTLPPLPLQKSPLFDSITQLDVEVSTTEADPIPPYLSTAMHRTAKEPRKDARAVVVQPRSPAPSEPKAQYRTARSIHFESPSVEVAVGSRPSQRLSPLYRPIRSSVELTSSLGLSAATSGGYHAVSSHFMYRPRIPSVRWVKMETSSDRLSVFAEQLHDLAPWIVGIIFLLALILGVFIVMAI